MGLFKSLKNLALGNEIKAFDRINGDKGALNLTVREKDGARRLWLSAKSQSDTTIVILTADQAHNLAAQISEADRML